MSLSRYKATLQKEEKIDNNKRRTKSSNLRKSSYLFIAVRKNNPHDQNKHLSRITIKIPLPPKKNKAGKVSTKYFFGKQTIAWPNHSCAY